MRMGVISDRRRKQKLRRIGRVAAIAGIASLLGIAALSSNAFAGIGDMLRGSVQVFSSGRGAQEEICLRAISVHALQLGVFDNRERALSETARLEQLGVRCMIWQKEKMRLISDVALERSGLDMRTAGGQEAYAINESLKEVRLTIGAGAEDIGAVRMLLLLPDETLQRLLGGAPVAGETARIRPLAEAARTAHPEHALYTGLAANLISWCDMMDALDEQAHGYAEASMFALCRGLRQALMTASTASAQRTPSTAADVMPPA